MATSSYQRLKGLVHDFDLERSILLEMLIEARGVDREHIGSWTDALHEVDERKAAYLAESAA